MDRKTAEKVLEEVKAQFDIRENEEQPLLFDHNHEELREGSWSICWEGYRDYWTYDFVSEVPGVFCEPILGCILAIYDAD